MGFQFEKAMCKICKLLLDVFESPRLLNHLRMSEFPFVERDMRNLNFSD